MILLELPGEIKQLLEEVDAPGDLQKHLQMVYSAADQVVRGVHQEWPNLALNDQLVLWGAALHDIGKTVYPDELHQPGSQHPAAGCDLLREKGYSGELAQIALTHENWNHPERSLEELLVSLADTIWKGIRDDKLEELIIAGIAESTQSDFWTVYQKMDAIVSRIADAGNERI